MITVTIWHNVATDAQGRHTRMLDGYQAGNPIVRVFAYQADPAGRPPVAIAEEAFAICNGHPSGGLNEVRASEHGTRPLPPPGPAPAVPETPSRLLRKELDQP